MRNGAPDGVVLNKSVISFRSATSVRPFGYPFAIFLALLSTWWYILVFEQHRQNLVPMMSGKVLPPDVLEQPSCWSLHSRQMPSPPPWPVLCECLLYGLHVYSLSQSCIQLKSVRHIQGTCRCQILHTCSLLWYHLGNHLFVMLCTELWINYNNTLIIYKFLNIFLTNHGTICPWGELSMGRTVYGASFPGASYPRAGCLWGELSIRRVVMGRDLTKDDDSAFPSKRCLVYM